MTPHYFSEWLEPDTQSTLSEHLSIRRICSLIQTKRVSFLSGVRVVEQHSMLLRALEARVQQYVDFVNLCTTALNNIQSDIQRGQTYLSQLQNDLHQDRQNFAFTTALLSDGNQSASTASVRSAPASIAKLGPAGRLYPRSGRLGDRYRSESTATTSANVASPVPACLQQSVSIPPELREIVGQLREAPVNWLPAIATQMNSLQRPVLLQQLGMSLQAQAAQQLQMAILPLFSCGRVWRLRFDDIGCL